MDSHAQCVLLPVPRPRKGSQRHGRRYCAEGSWTPWDCRARVYTGGLGFVLSVFPMTVSAKGEALHLPGQQCIVPSVWQGAWCITGTQVVFTE